MRCSGIKIHCSGHLMPTKYSWAPGCKTFPRKSRVALHSKGILTEARDCGLGGSGTKLLKDKEPKKTDFHFLSPPSIELESLHQSG